MSKLGLKLRIQVDNEKLRAEHQKLADKEITEVEAEAAVLILNTYFDSILKQIEVAAKYNKGHLVLQSRFVVPFGKWDIAMRAFTKMATSGSVYFKAGLVDKDHERYLTALLDINQKFLDQGLELKINGAGNWNVTIVLPEEEN